MTEQEDAYIDKINKELIDYAAQVNALTIEREALETIVDRLEWENKGIAEWQHEWSLMKANRNKAIEVVVALTTERDEYREKYNSTFTALDDCARLNIEIAAERDALKEASDKFSEAEILMNDVLRKQLMSCTAERDAYAEAADSMAASHKVERDHWYAFQNTQVSLMTEITARGDALTAAARLALDALSEPGVDDFHYEKCLAARQALKAVL